MRTDTHAQFSFAYCYYYLLVHAHHVEDDGTVAANLGSKWVNGKTTIGGSPPFQHEGIAVYRDRFEGR